MTIREKLESFDTIEDLLDYLESLGIDTSVLRVGNNDLGILVDNILKEDRYKIELELMFIEIIGLVV